MALYEGRLLYQLQQVFCFIDTGALGCKFKIAHFISNNNLYLSFREGAQVFTGWFMVFSATLNNISVI
jgi:hypothetical protein